MHVCTGDDFISEISELIIFDSKHSLNTINFTCRSIINERKHCDRSMLTWNIIG